MVKIADTIIVGGGVSGFSCALTLTRGGRECVIVEREPQMLPLMRGFRRRGVRFDCGLHFAGGFREGEWGRRFLEYLGIADDLEWEFCEEECALQIRLGDDEYFFPTGWEVIADWLVSLNRGKEKELRKFVVDVRRVFERIPEIFMSKRRGQDVLLKGEGLELLEERLAEFEDPVRSVLGVHSFLYGMRTVETPWDYFCRVAGSYYQSNGFLRGGGARLAKVLCGAAEKRGIGLFAGEEVTSLRFCGGDAGWEVVCASGRVLRSREVVFTGHPRLLPDLLVGDGRNMQRFCRRLRRLHDGISGWIAYGIIPKKEERGNKPVNLFYHPEKAIDWCETGTESLRERCFYLNICEDAEERARKVTVIVPESLDALRADGIDRDLDRGGYRRCCEEQAKEIEAYVEATAGDLLEGVEWVEFGSPFTMRRFLNTPYGSLYGIVHHLGTYTLLPTTPLPGLYMSGQNVVAPGLFGALLSGILTGMTMKGENAEKEELFHA
ncbi:MAG: FAD-dependent oxidoreductase [Lentisphaerae bacterium]|nr:MAG: FAD-dependent oxidoreductase [Lentisphaerota bacterium]